MKKVDFLPLGSIVIIRGGVKKVMIISRGLKTKLENGTKYFDYGACLYPEGLTSEEILYFNHEDIFKTIHKGFSDDDDKLMTENINNWLFQAHENKIDPLTYKK